jgi:hypothetical protein
LKGKIRSIPSKELTFRYIASKDLAVDIYHQNSPRYCYLPFCLLPRQFCYRRRLQGLTNEHAISYKQCTPSYTIVEPLAAGTCQDQPRACEAKSCRSMVAGSRRRQKGGTPVETRSGWWTCFSGRRRAGRPRQLKEEQLQPNPSASACSTRACRRSWTMPLQFQFQDYAVPFSS